jgi:hypothetical protein
MRMAGRPTSLTLREQYCVQRSVAQATNCQSFTMLRGNPGEAESNANARPDQAWNFPPSTAMIALNPGINHTSLVYTGLV